MKRHDRIAKKQQQRTNEAELREWALNPKNTTFHLRGRNRTPVGESYKRRLSVKRYKESSRGQYESRVRVRGS